MKPTIPALTEEFTRLIGPEAFAKAEAAIAAAKIAAEAAAKAAAEKAAAAAAAAKAAAEKAAAEKAAAAAANPPAAPVGRAGTPLPASPGAEGTPRPTPVPAAAASAAPRPAAPAAAAPRPATPAPAAVPMPTLPVQATPHAAKGYDFDALVAANQIVEAAQILDRAGFALDTITGVDWMAQGEMEVVYDYFHPTESLRVVVRTRVPRATPDVPTITAVFAGANWHERETHDFFGIRFVGHPNLKPFLLPEDADFHPLRKDYHP